MAFLAFYIILLREASLHWTTELLNLALRCLTYTQMAISQGTWDLICVMVCIM